MGVTAVIHTATLHKPHVATHSKQAFVETNVTGTLNLLEAAIAAGVKSFVFTSTTSAFGSQLRPEGRVGGDGVTEELPATPKNVYGTTKLMAENLCELFFRERGLPVVVLRTSRFFPEDDEDPAVRSAYPFDNAQATELLYRRLDIADAVSAHLLAMAHAPEIGLGRYIVSATSPFEQRHLAALARDAASVVRELYSGLCAALCGRAAGGYFPRSTVSMSTTARGASWAGIRNSISPTCCAACVKGAIFAVPWRARWERKATTTRCLTMGRIRSPRNRRVRCFARHIRRLARVTGRDPA